MSPVLTLDAAERWDGLVRGLPDSDVYFTSGYHRAHTLGRPGDARLFHFERGGETLVYPFLLRPIERVGDLALEEKLTDIESVYGFTGPIATTTQADFLAEAWRAFDDWAAAEGVVAEFVRLHPLLETERFVSDRLECAVVREHVVVDLRQDLDEIWTKVYSKTNRNMIRKAERGGVEVAFESPETHIASFTQLYHATMDRNRAGRDYYFDRAHFESLVGSTPALMAVAHVGGDVVALSLFLIGGDRMHYHLSGCSERGLTVGANNLILHRAVSEARIRGSSLLHLGGGRTGAADDALLRFKSGFSPLRRIVRIGRRVHDVPRYQDLCAKRRAQVSVPAGFFLAYRYEPRA